MGVYLNPGNEEFASILRAKLYVDKSELIAFMNERLGTAQCLVCNTRPRRFGKTYAAQMLAAYYSRGVDSRPLFDSLAVANPPNTDPEDVRQAKQSAYLHRINQVDTLFWDMARFFSCFGNTPEAILPSLCRWTTRELIEAFPDVSPNDDLPLAERLARISDKTGRRFFILIDEWDVLFREAKDNRPLIDAYLRFLRSLFKGAGVRRYLLGAYLTGILPIASCGTESALTDFDEFTMTSPQPLGEFIGFTEAEVKHLCDETGQSFSDLQRLYDGYRFEDVGPVYNPLAVCKAVTSSRCQPYWTPTGSHASLRHFLELPFDGLADAVTRLLAGKRQSVDVLSFRNDLTSLAHRDDVLTLLIHLGYLGYAQKTAQVFIPNEEIRQEFRRALKKSDLPAFVKITESAI